MTPGRSILTLAGVAVLAVACTGGGPASSSSVSPPAPTTTTTLAAAAATAEYSECLRSHGVEVDDIPVDPDGRPRFDAVAGQLDYTDQATIDAVAECASILSAGALDLGYDDQYRREVVGRIEAFSRCVRARGVDDFPDPVPGFIGVGSPYSTAEIPYDDPDLASAVEACRDTVFGAGAAG